MRGYLSWLCPVVIVIVGCGAKPGAADGGDGCNKIWHTDVSPGGAAAIQNGALHMSADTPVPILGQSSVLTETISGSVFAADDTYTLTIHYDGFSADGTNSYAEFELGSVEASLLSARIYKDRLVARLLGGLETVTHTTMLTTPPTSGTITVALMPSATPADHKDTVTLTITSGSDSVTTTADYGTSTSPKFDLGADVAGDHHIEINWDDIDAPDYIYDDRVSDSFECNSIHAS